MAMTTQTVTLWRHANFVRLWLSETISSFGGQFSGLAIPFTALYVLNASPTEVSFLFAAGTAPFLLFGLFVGVWVERHRKRRTMVLANIGRCLLLTSIPIAFLLGGLSLFLLYSTSFLVGSLQAFYDVSYQAYLPSLVERNQLTEGNSKLEASRSTSQVAGPTLAGITVQAISAPFAIAVDAVGFLASAFSLRGIKHEEQIDPRVNSNSVWSDIREGLSVVFRENKLRSIAGSTATSNFFSNALGPVAFFYVADRDLAANNLGLGLSASVVGLIFSVGAAGGILAAVYSRRIARAIGVGWGIIASALIAGIGGLSFYIVTPSMSVPVFNTGGFVMTQAMGILILGSFVTAFGVVVYNINQVSLRQAIVPLRLQGRMNATMRFLVWGTLPLGATVGGIMAALIGLRPTILITAVGGTLSFLWVLFSPVRGLKDIPEPMS